MTTSASPMTPGAAATLPTRTVRLFAGMAAAAGVREVTVAWTGGTARGLRAVVAAAVPHAADLVARSAVAVGTTYVPDDAAVPEGEIAIIPPVSGG